MRMTVICFWVIGCASVFADSSGLQELSLDKSGVMQTSSAVGEIWYVMKGNTGGDGSKANPYPELKDALDVLNGLPTMPVGGVAIYVSAFDVDNKPAKYVPVGAVPSDVTTGFLINKPVHIAFPFDISNVFC